MTKIEMPRTRPATVTILEARAAELRSLRGEVVELARWAMGRVRGRWSFEATCKMVHEGTVGGTQLAEARRVLGEEACRKIFDEELERLIARDRRQM